jgi:hypothetical protein
MPSKPSGSIAQREGLFDDAPVFGDGRLVHLAGHDPLPIGGILPGDAQIHFHGPYLMPNSSTGLDACRFCSYIRM